MDHMVILCLPFKVITTISHLSCNIVILTNHVYNCFPKNENTSSAQRYVPIITAFGRLRWKDCEFKAHRDHTMSFCFKIIAKKKQKNMKMLKRKSKTTVSRVCGEDYITLVKE